MSRFLIQASCGEEQAQEDDKAQPEKWEARLWRWGHCQSWFAKKARL